MIICGIKLTHDGAVALIDNGKLVFSYEMEKLDNRPRYSTFSITIEELEEILHEYGYSLAKIDQIVIDGWDQWEGTNLNQKEGLISDFLRIPTQNGKGITINKLAGYGHIVGKDEDILLTESYQSQQLEIAYNSYPHVSGHILGAYCTSPFSKNLEDSYVLVWDGGMPPQLFYYQAKETKVLSLGYLFPFIGYIYINFPFAFKPFNAYTEIVAGGEVAPSMGIAGKAMAYIALGKVDSNILAEYRRIYNELLELVQTMEVNIDVVAIFTAGFIKKAKEYCDTHNLDERNMLTSFHVFVQELLLEALEEKVRQYPQLSPNLCFAGGSALNIKWNSNIRGSGIFEKMWVPPFPNDSGSALGTACCEMVLKDKIHSLDWNVYSGPKIKNESAENTEYSVHDCSLENLAHILHTFNEPVVFLNGHAELGPRALGNRSILAAASDPSMKDTLNFVKGREAYRPIAPICIEEESPKVFDPGLPDPYMLYEHTVRDNWIEQVPAICHLDHTARLQTVNKENNPQIYELLVHYNRISGIPLLCNTSANFNGKGFFPDVKSVMEWGRVKFIWCEGKLYSKLPIGQHESILVEK